MCDSVASGYHSPPGPSENAHQTPSPVKPRGDMAVFVNKGVVVVIEEYMTERLPIDQATPAVTTRRHPKGSRRWLAQGCRLWTGACASLTGWGRAASARNQTATLNCQFSRDDFFGERETSFTFLAMDPSCWRRRLFSTEASAGCRRGWPEMPARFFEAYASVQSQEPVFRRRRPRPWW